MNSPARAFGAVGGEPLFIARGEGPFLFDIDGNRYLDYVGSWGPLILGHVHPRVQAAVVGALGRGATFGAPTEIESQLAEVIVDAVPSIEKVRFVSSGTEASMSAIRLARVHETRFDCEICRLLSRPRRQLARAGGVERNNSRRTQQSRHS